MVRNNKKHRVGIYEDDLHKLRKYKSVTRGQNTVYIKTPLVRDSITIFGELD